jgi:hypothetical protein
MQEIKNASHHSDDYNAAVTVHPGQLRSGADANGSRSETAAAATGKQTAQAHMMDGFDRS